jgi:hypothetical protein
MPLPKSLGDEVELVTSPLVVPADGRKVIADILSHRYEKVPPKNRLDGTTLHQTFNYEIESSEKELTDLQDTFIYFRWSLREQNNDGSLKAIPREQYDTEKDEDGLDTGVYTFTGNTQMVSAEPAAPLCMVQDAYLTINDVPFPAHSQGLYYYSLYWRLLLDSSPHARQTCLRDESNFIPRQPRLFDNYMPNASVDMNLALLTNLTSGGKEAETMIPLLTDWTTFRRAIPPGCKMEVALDRARCLQYIFSSEPNDSKTYDILIHDSFLVVKRLTLDPRALSTYNALLSQSPAVFPFVARHMRALDIPRSSLSFDFEVGSQGGSVLPFLIRFGLVRKQAFEGSYKKSVYNFERFQLQQIRIKEANGFISSEIGVSERKDIDPNQVTFSSFPAITGIQFSTDNWLHKGTALSREEFGNGYAIYTLDLSRSATSQDEDPDLQSSPRREKVTITLDFLKQTPYDIVLVLEEQHHKEMRMDGTRLPTFSDGSEGD